MNFGTIPGDTLLETMECRGITRLELTAKTKEPLALINGIIAGDYKITPEFADKLEKVLAVPASFWNNRQKNYDDWLWEKHSN